MEKEKKKTVLLVVKNPCKNCIQLKIVNSGNKISNYKLNFFFLFEVSLFILLKPSWNAEIT